MQTILQVPSDSSSVTPEELRGSLSDELLAPVKLPIGWIALLWKQ